MCVILLAGRADAFQQLQEAAASFEQGLVDSHMLQVSTWHSLCGLHPEL